MIAVTCLIQHAIEIMLEPLLMMRVNSTNVQYEGFRIRGVGRRMNLKVKSVKTRCVSKVNIGVNLSCFQSVPYHPLLAPIYRWPGLKDREGSNTDYNIDI
jgi:hypothetical protein